MTTRRNEELQQQIKRANKLAKIVSIIGVGIAYIFNVFVLNEDAMFNLIICIFCAVIVFIVLKKFYLRCVLKWWYENNNTSE